VETVGSHLLFTLPKAEADQPTEPPERSLLESPESKESESVPSVSVPRPAIKARLRVGLLIVSWIRSLRLRSRAELLTSSSQFEAEESVNSHRPPTMTKKTP